MPTFKDHYQAITDQILALLEEGKHPWVRPFDPAKAGGPSAPMNPTTGRRYRGINTLLLGMSPLAFSTADPRWCSYKQAAEKGWQVRKGEKSTVVFFYKQLQARESGQPDAGDDRPSARMIPMLRSYNVFHASQIDGVPAHEPPALSEVPWRRPEAAEIILQNSSAVTRIGGDKAFYSPGTDHIQLPPDHAFLDEHHWSATMLHELAHWTGHEKRLNRDLRNRFGSHAYAQEELRAELASVFIGSEVGLPCDIPNHASYMASWITALRDDKREIFRAASDAQKAADMLLGFHPDYAAQVLAAADPAPVADGLAAGLPLNNRPRLAGAHL